VVSNRALLCPPYPKTRSPSVRIHRNKIVVFLVHLEVKMVHLICSQIERKCKRKRMMRKINMERKKTSMRKRMRKKMKISMLTNF
jgi:hypothetical protein